MYPGLRYADKKYTTCMQISFFVKCFLSTKFDLQLKKKQKIYGAISILFRKNFVVAIQKMVLIQFPYMEFV